MKEQFLGPPRVCPRVLQAHGEGEEHTDLKVASTGWHGPLGLHSTGWRVKERLGSLLGPRPWQATGSRTGVEVENTAVSPEGQVLGGPDFTRVALKGFRTHTLRKTCKVSHAESRFSSLFLDRHFSGLKDLQSWL